MAIVAVQPWAGSYNHVMVDLVRKRLRITGVVQGVGFRPFVWRLATRLAIRGWVENDPDGVTVDIEGPAAAVSQFLVLVTDTAPPLSRIGAIEASDLPPTHDAAPGFAILESRRSASPRTAVIPPDIAPCAACLAEMADRANRRHRHAFISCTDCGPRFTIIESLPYDRDATTMRGFPMCVACRAEYRDPASRRFHAQTIACPDCGPSVWWCRAGVDPVSAPAADTVIRGEAAIQAAREMIQAGGIVAVKGVGGFHLACDATNASAVERLRVRKRRARKPFAVMVAGVAAAREIAVVGEQERRLLERPERSVVLLRRAAVNRRVVDAVAPGSDTLGVMLSPSPLHLLLCVGLPPLVMTSGNLSEEPIATGNREAVERLSAIADAFLMHDRDILVACDDSVVRCVIGVPLPVRRSRGHCPLPIGLPEDGPPLLAVGGELKAALCVARGTEAIMSQHVGDVENLETLAALDRTAAGLLTLLEVSPAAIVADLHPGQLSTRWARDFAAARGLPLIRIQHHEAHVAALLTEHALPLADAEGTIGVCFDGTGYGRDGTIQGGEILVVRRGSLVRAAHLLPFALPGGEAAIRHPWRTAVAVLRAAGVERRDDFPCMAAAPARDLAVVDRQMARGFGCVATTSMGRLFDAVASLVGLRHSIDYEGEAAIDLEQAAEVENPLRRYAGRAVAGHEGCILLDWRPVIRGIVEDLASGLPPPQIAAAFHEAIADLVCEACVMLRVHGACGAVGLTGGVFQNALLTERTCRTLHAAGFDVLLHRAVPPNDGGLALGQVTLGRHHLRCQ